MMKLLRAMGSALFIAAVLVCVGFWFRGAMELISNTPIYVGLPISALSVFLVLYRLRRDWW